MKNSSITKRRYEICYQCILLVSSRKKYFDKSVKKTFVIPAWLNTAALGMGINFSQVLQEALLAKVQAK